MTQWPSSRMKLCKSITLALRVGALATVYGFLASTTALAQSNALANFNIPEQSLSAALKSFADQTGMQLLYRQEDIKGLVSHSIVGKMSKREALEQLLQGANLEIVYSSENAATIREKSSSRSSDEKKGSRASTEVESSPLATPILSHQQVDAPAQMESVVVTGSRLKTIDAEPAMPVNIYTREDIERSGQPTLTQFLNTLNEVSVQSPESIAVRAGGISSVQLRGLPSGSTLVLINGRRVESAGTGGGTIFPLDLIPFTAIERVEILPVGSSAVYGGDALAGVVNFVLKSSVDGPALYLRYGSANGTDDGALSFATGGTYERGSFMVLASYSANSRLSSRDRDLFWDADYRRFGGQDDRVRTCTPGTVSSTTAANLPGLTAGVAGIPSIAGNPNLTIADFSSTAGFPNLCANAVQGNGRALIPDRDTKTLHGSANRLLGEHWSVFGELTYTGHSMSTHDQGVPLNNALVPATNPYNPFGSAVRVTSRLGLDSGMTTGQTLDLRFIRPLIGLRGQFDNGWDFEATASTAKDESTTTNLNISANSAALNAALASTNPATALNPFTPGQAASKTVLQGIWSNTGSTLAGTRDLLSAFLRGPAFQLPAGPVDVIAGLEHGRDSYDIVSILGQSGPLTDRGRHVDSFYGEARVPLFSAESQKGGTYQVATLSLAARNDRFSDFDGKTTYQSGLEIRPIQTLLLRGAYATSFKPPLLTELTGPYSTFSLDGLGLRDPLRGNELITGANATFGPNPSLRPETGAAHTLGIMWEPGFSEGLHFALTDWKIRLSNQISLLDFQTLIDNEAFLPELITRSPASGSTPGPITSLTWTYGNIGKLEVAGTDADVAYSFDTALGKWNLSSSVTRTRRYDVQLTPLTPVQSQLNNLNELAWAPKWKGRLSAGLQRGGWSFGLTGRYLGEYNDVAPSTRKLGDYWYVDGSISVDLKKTFPNIFTRPKTAALTFGVVNLTNRLPEYAGTTYFYDFTQADVRGRYTSLQLTLAR